MVHKLSVEGVVTGALDLYRAGGGRTGDHVDVLLNQRLLREAVRSAVGMRDGTAGECAGSGREEGCEGGHASGRRQRIVSGLGAMAARALERMEEADGGEWEVEHAVARRAWELRASERDGG